MNIKVGGKRAFVLQQFLRNIVVKIFFSHTTDIYQKSYFQMEMIELSLKRFAFTICRSYKRALTQ